MWTSISSVLLKDLGHQVSPSLLIALPFPRILSTNGTVERHQAHRKSTEYHRRHPQILLRPQPLRSSALKMSAGPAPPNPGTPKRNPNAPNPSMFAKYPGRFATGAALGVTAFLYFNYAATPRDSPAMSMKTPGVGNIEKAYTNAGATPTHTKAYGGTQQGDNSSVHIRDGGGTGESTKQSPFEKEGMGDEQRPAPATKGGEIFDQTMLGSHKGK